MFWVYVLVAGRNTGGLFVLGAVLVTAKRRNVAVGVPVYFGLMTITESMWPFPSSSVAELVGSFSPTPSTRNL